MKKCICIALFPVVVVVGWGEPRFRLAGEAAIDFAARPSLADLESSLDDPANFFYGVFWEVITNGAVGFGMDGNVRFASQTTSDSSRALRDWWIDWNGGLFLSFHPFGGGSLIDPFFKLGYGNAGRASTTREIAGSWYQDDKDLWLYRWNEGRDEGLTNMSLYLYFALGAAIEIDGFFLGLQASWRPVFHGVPGSQILNYPLKNIQATAFAGISLGPPRVDDR